MTLHSSQMGRGGHRDDRRRRLLAEDLTANSGMPALGTSETLLRNDQPPAHKSENYGDADFLQTQVRLTDLIPRRLISYLLILKVGLAAIGGLIALYVWFPDLLGNSQPRPAMADLGNYGSLGNWFASLLLLTAGLLAIVIYSVRRHKLDDYRGRYHVWLWAAACWFAMATDVAASLHQGLQQVMISVAGTRIAGDGSIWWLVPSTLIIGSVGSRLLVDMRSSRLSSAALILAAIAYLTASVAFFHGITLQFEVYQFLLVQGALLGGHLLLAMSMGLHARYVLLDAEGALPKRPRKKKAEKKKTAKKTAETKTEQANRATTGDEAEEDPTASGSSDAADSDDSEEESGDEESGDTWVAVDPPHGSLQPVLKRVAPSGTPAVPSLSQKIVVPGAESSSSDSGTDISKLSKADRKALKKRLIDERLKRERKASNW
ncbi:MAG: hypothetical protein ACLP9L_40520 [Thermoguttaceae bacterium]